jgi:hypothetical protein
VLAWQHIDTKQTFSEGTQPPLITIPLPTTFPDAALNLEREDEIRDAL